MDVWRCERDVGVQLDVEIAGPTSLEFQIAVAQQMNTEVFESFCFDMNGERVQPIEIMECTVAVSTNWRPNKAG